jgi:hypothetical protein
MQRKGKGEGELRAVARRQAGVCAPTAPKIGRKADENYRANPGAVATVAPPVTGRVPSGASSGQSMIRMPPMRKRRRDLPSEASGRDVYSGLDDRDTMKEGHVGLSNEKRKEASSGEFQGALSYLAVNDRTAYFVIHVYSTAYDLSQHLQRSNVRGRDNRQNFLERLGFAFYDGCNVLSNRRCYFQVIEEVRRGRLYSPFSPHQRRIDMAHGAFDKIISNLSTIYSKMAEVDRMLFDAGIELPWSGLKLAEIVYDATEKVYEKGHVYDFYKDILDITKLAKMEVFVVDAYPDEEVLNLYLEKVDPQISIRILTNEPRKTSAKAYQNFTNFVAVAKKFKLKPGVTFEVRKNTDCHDRLFFIDGDCWVMGQSMKDAGRKPTYLIKINSGVRFKKIWEDVWSQAQVVV